MRIVATDGIDTQYKKLRKDITVEQAKDVLFAYYSDDYLGLDWYLEDDEGNEIWKYEYE